MIIRIATEGQYRLDDTFASELQQLERRSAAACAAGDEPAFRAALGELVAFVRANGSALHEDELAGSDVILPPPDATMAEAGAEFSAEGLLPD